MSAKNQDELLSQLQARLDALQTEVNMLKAAQGLTNATTAAPVKTSRRRLLKGLAVSAASAALISGFSGNQPTASAAAEGTVTGSSTTVFGLTSAPNQVTVFKPSAGVYGLIGVSRTGITVNPADNNDIGVLGFGAVGVRGVTNDGNGVQGNSVSGTGVVGVSTTGGGVTGSSNTGGDGVAGSSVTGNGVTGTSTSGNGVNGTSTTSGIGVNGVSTNGSGVAGTSSTGAGVNGKSASGNGVLGTSDTNAGVSGTATSGAGLQGNSQSGYGASLAGGLAPLYLSASNSAGAPQGTHQAGEFYVDTNNALYYSVASGNPATWVKLSSSSIITFLPTPIRVALVQPTASNALTSDGTNNLNAQDVQITGVRVSGSQVPAGAKGIIASLTSIGATSSGNLRLWPSDGNPPNANTLNIPARPNGTGFNLTSTVITGLGSDGRVSIAFAGAAGSACGFAIDVVAYIN